MTAPTEFKTRTDGSIDTAHYMARGREMRSAAFLAALGRLRRPFAIKLRPGTRQRAMHTPAAIRPAQA